VLKQRSRNRENTSIVSHHGDNLNCGVTNGIQTVWLTESCFTAHFELDFASCTSSKASPTQPQDGYFVSAHADHVSESGLLFSMVVQGEL